MHESWMEVHSSTPGSMIQESQCVTHTAPRTRHHRHISSLSWPLDHEQRTVAHPLRCACPGKYSPRSLPHLVQTNLFSRCVKPCTCAHNTSGLRHVTARQLSSRRRPQGLHVEQCSSHIHPTQYSLHLIIRNSIFTTLARLK
jgi:hypothetical protein